jgi:arylsulfatase A-like enzyme
MEAHWPLRPPYEHRARQLMPGMGYREATRIAGQFYGPKWTAGEKRSQRAEDAVRRLYNAEVAYQDDRLGALLDVLRERISLDNTLVIITADHGEHQGEHGHWDHVFSVGEALIHVPLIIRYPAAFPPGRRVSGQCQLVDIIPTVFDVLAAPCPVEGLPGRTIVPERFQPREYAYAEVYPYYGHLERMSQVTGMKRDIAEFLGYLRSVRTDQYKFVWSDRGQRSLYDIAADPQEAHDISDEFPDIAKKLETHMTEWWNAQPRYEPRETLESTPTGEDTLRGLRGLGYVK